MKVLFFCGVGRCDQNGTMHVSQCEWGEGSVKRLCPACGKMLSQKDLHFEDLNVALQSERIAICSKNGPLTIGQRRRLLAIHKALRHPDARTLTRAQENLVMKIASEVMRRARMSARGGDVILLRPLAKASG
jgi:hypothetical protein